MLSQAEWQAECILVTKHSWAQRVTGPVRASNSRRAEQAALVGLLEWHPRQGGKGHLGV